MTNSTLNIHSLEQRQPKRLWASIFFLALPVIVEMGLATLADITNMIMVGHLGVDALNAIGLTLQPLMLGMVIFNGFSVGATALIARFIGERNQELAGRTFQQSLLVSAVTAFGLVIGLYFVAPWILVLMGESDPKVIALGTSYIHWMIPGLFFQWQSTVIFASLRGAGDTVTPMVANVMIYLLNVLGNYFFIFGHWIFPEMGVHGAGLASSLARTTGFTILMILIHRPHSILRIRWKSLFPLDWSLLRRIVKIGAPAALEQAILRIGQTFYTRVVKSLGGVAFAAHTTAINAESLSYMPGWGFSVAATTMVGQKLGEKKPDEAEASANISLRFAMAIMGCMALVFLFFPEVLIRIYVKANDPNAGEFVRLGARNMRIVALAQIPQAIQFVLAGALRGAGYTKPVLYSTMVGVWVGRLLCSYIFIFYFHWGLVGAWVAMCIDWLMRSSYVTYLWRKGKWKETEV